MRRGYRSSAWSVAGPSPGARQAGLSLVELLVSMTILAVAATIALVLYDGARQSFKVGENVSEQQQAVRIAFDVVSSDIRQAGFNTNPDGNEARPDEQIEAALDTAIVVRADFDADDPVASHDPEDTLGGPGSAFLTVSTGNDEIRAYVLAKPDGSSSDTVTFQADVGQTVRDGTLETIDIDGVALVHDDPPYTLYRVTLEDDGTPHWTVLIENVRSMRFHYADRAGNPLIAVGGLDTPGNVQARAAIRRVGLELEALTRDPDLHWSDPSDPDPRTRSYRKFRLAADVTPRNLGLRGIKDFQSDTVAPSAPAAPQLYPGHCGGLYASWPANPPADEVVYYRLRFGVDPGNLVGQRAIDGTQYYLGGLLDGVRYYAALQAIDAAGNQSALGPMTSAVTRNTTVPEAPVDFVVSTGADDRIELSWSAVTENTAATVGDPYSPLLRDLAGYRLYRDDFPGFTPRASNRIADETALPGLPAPAFVDDRVVNCRHYYYVVTAVDRCGQESSPSTEEEGRSYTSVQPKTPSNVESFFASLTETSVNWVAVRENVDGDPVGIDRYEIFRAGPMEEGPPPAVPGGFSLHAVVEGEIQFKEFLSLESDEAVWYVVRAVDDCINASEYSAPARPTCSFAGHVEFQSPAYGTDVWGATTVKVAVLDGTGIYTEIRIRGFNESTLDEWEFTFPTAGPVWSATWDARPEAGYPIGTYRIEAEVDQVTGTSVCTASTWTRVYLKPPWE